MGISKTTLNSILTMLGETSATTIAVQRDTYGLSENSEAARAGWSIAGMARKQIEKETGLPVVSSVDFLGGRKRIADPVRLIEKIETNTPIGSEYAIVHLRRILSRCGLCRSNPRQPQLRLAQHQQIIHQQYLPRYCH